jgi:H+/gluconate symporter-like permease
MFDILAIVLALGLLIFFAFRGISVIILAPVMASLAVLFAGGLSILGAYTQIFMTSTGAFIVAYFPLFLLGAVFGKLMDECGAANVIARGIIHVLGAQRAILAVVLCCGALTYGGVSLFVVAFAVFPIARSLFRQTDIPKRLIPAALALGSFTFTMSALPGTPSIQNAIPMPYFGTTAFAAPGLGMITALVMLGLGVWWLNLQQRQAKARHEGYQPVKTDAALNDSQQQQAMWKSFGESSKSAPSSIAFAKCIAPIVAVIAINYVFINLLLPTMDTAFLTTDTYGTTSLGKVAGLWSIIVSLLCAIALLLALHWRKYQTLVLGLSKGAEDAVMPIFNTASLVGFGAVIAALPAFAIIQTGVLSLGQGNPLVSLAVAVNALAAITGSASGGMSIALEVLGPIYLELAKDANISLDIMHRVAAVAAGTLDALPHNGAVITLLSICKLTHQQAYGNVFMVAVVFPIVALVVLIALGTVFGSF